MKSLRRVAPLYAVVGVCALAAACGGSPTQPDTSPRVTAIAPAAGSTVGGTAVTITGTNFAAGATVTIGGVAAADVGVVNATTITATAPPHAAGSADVLVMVGGKAASLTGAFMYVANAPPVIASFSVRGAKPREPAQFADLDEAVSVSAVVTDAETPVSQLTFAWTAETGAFTGTGANVTWTAPHTFATPATVTLTLTVTETFQTIVSGAQVTGQNVVKGSTSVRLHNSPKEVGDLAYDFLDGFSKQLDPDFVVRNFTPNCAGTASERADVAGNQQDVIITAYKLGTPDTTVPFTGHCTAFRNRQGDACSLIPADWTSYIKAAIYHTDLKPYIGHTIEVTGTDQVTAVLENDQWKLCASDWDQATAVISSRDGRERFPTTIRFKR